MQDEEQPTSIRGDLMDRLKALEAAPSSETLAELAYRRSREALEHALDEAGQIRLQALEDARATRERELTSLMEALKALRDNAQAQIDSMLREAEVEAARLRNNARAEAGRLVERASSDAAAVRGRAETVRMQADERAKEVERIEAEFNAVLADVMKRLGYKDDALNRWKRGK